MTPIPAPVAPGQPVVLDLPELGRFDARSEWAEGDRLAVALFARLPVLPSSLIGCPVRVAHATPRGVVRLAAAVLGADRGGVLELTVLTEPELDQRRGHVRVAAPLPGTVEPADHGRPALHTYTLDVSGAGVLVAGAGPVAVGEPVALTLRVPGADAPLVAESHIVRVSREGHVGVEFDRLGRREQERLVRFVFERQRLERQAARERG